MKFLFAFLLSLASFNSFAQIYIEQTFEFPYDGYRGNFYLDTVNCSNNKWQIGKPQKTIFDSAYSFPNVIVTDTLHQYSLNDTSILYFYISGFMNSYLKLSFYYQLDIDSLSIAKVEISGDDGVNWIDPITEDSAYMFYWVGGKPRLDTSTNGWRRFNLNMDTWSRTYPGHTPFFPHYRTSETVMYRFTFISGGDSSAHHDGWMMDNFTAENLISVSTTAINSSSLLLNVYPNPTNGIINLHPNFKSNAQDKIVVYNMQGQVVYENVPNGSTSLVLPLPNGVYILKYFGESGVATERIAVIK
jgi:hypothetical protein